MPCSRCSRIAGLPTAMPAREHRVSFPQRDEPWGASSQSVHACELGRPKSLHVDAVTKKGVPGKVAVSVRDGDTRAMHDEAGVAGPHEIQLRAARRDGRRDCNDKSGAPVKDHS